MRIMKSLCVLLFIGLMGTAHAATDSYPTHLIKIIVPWPAGGVADVLARITSQSLSHKLGQTVIVDNRPGAGTNIGSEIVAKSAADGYTLLLASSNNAVNMTLYKNVQYNIVKDFEPISELAVVPNILVVN